MRALTLLIIVYLVRLHVALELRHCAIRAYPELSGRSTCCPHTSPEPTTYLLRDVSDEAFVVGDEDDASVPCAECCHERVETLDIEVVSRLHGCVSKRISNGSGQLQTSSSSRT